MISPDFLLSRIQHPVTRNLLVFLRRSWPVPVRVIWLLTTLTFTLVWIPLLVGVRGLSSLLLPLLALVTLVALVPLFPAT
jgi:hypothetical protein